MLSLPADGPRATALCTHVRQEGQPGHPLHGQDQEGDHGQTPARGPLLDLPQGLSEGSAAAPATGKGVLSHGGRRGQSIRRNRVEAAEAGLQAATCPAARGPGASRGHPPTPCQPRPGPRAGSRQLLQGALLVDLVGAVGDVGVEVPLGVLLQDVTDVLHAHLRPVPLLQVLEEPVGATVRPKGCWSVHGPARVSAHTHTRAHAQSKAPRCTHTRCWVGQLLGPPPGKPQDRSAP